MRGLLLVNLGTPEAPEAGPVRTYLREFLSDPRVLDIPDLGRWLLLNLIILPTRPAKSAAAYREIWTERGSPLLFHSQDLAEGVQAELGQGWKVQLAMRYGRPSIAGGLQALQQAGVDEVWVLPLYPQNASSSTGSTLEKVYLEAGKLPVPLKIRMFQDFFDDPGFIAAQAELAREAVSQADHVLFSYHGIPERQIHFTDLGGAHCLKDGCCEAMGPANRACYRAQCFATTRALAEALGLSREQYTVSFQSRLGKTPWIQPFTDELLPVLAKEHATLAVLTPSFVADCLETIEEIGIRAKADFEGAGGSTLLRVPCVNSDPAWVRAVARMVQEAAG